MKVKKGLRSKNRRLEYNAPTMSLLESIHSPADLRALPVEQLRAVSDEIRNYILETMSRVGGTPERHSAQLSWLSRCTTPSTRHMTVSSGMWATRLTRTRS